MTLQDYLILGSYGYTTAVLLYLYRSLRNHYEHRLRQVERQVGLRDDASDDSDLMGV